MNDVIDAGANVPAPSQPASTKASRRGETPTTAEIEADVSLKMEIARAINEALRMNESMAALIAVMLEDSDEKTEPLLEAMKACMQRMERSIVDADESVCRAGWWQCG